MGYLNKNKEEIISESPFKVNLILSSETPDA
jgi:hypothetical protein